VTSVGNIFTMITITIPKGQEVPDLGKELSSARNIKDRLVRNNTIKGL